jgi:methylenetetrahydrofolate--tRNA-(uracil-5-)-methyltransferase
VAALSIYADSVGKRMPPLPEATMIGSLMSHIHTPQKNFQPMNSNMGILPSSGKRRGDRKTRYLELSAQAIDAMTAYRESHPWLFKASAIGDAAVSPL